MSSSSAASASASASASAGGPSLRRLPPYDRPVTAVLLVGGPEYDTEFRPLSLTVPKPRFPVAGTPLIMHHMRAVVREQVGVQEILIIGTYEERDMQHLVNDAELELNVSVRYLREDRPHGTAGCLSHFADAIRETKPFLLIVMHGDVLCDFPLREMVEFHMEHDRPITLLSHRVQADESHKYGCMVLQRDGSVKHFVQQPKSYVSNMINCGVYVLTATLLDFIDTIVAQRQRGVIVPSAVDVPRHITRLEQDVFFPQANLRMIYAFETKRFWLRVKEPVDALKASGTMLEEMHPPLPRFEHMPTVEGDCFISERATVDPSAVIGPNVVIGEGVTVQEGARIRNAIILSNTDIEANACVINSIIGWSNTVGAWARVEGTALTQSAHTVTVTGLEVRIAPEVCVTNCVVLGQRQILSNVADAIIL